MASAGIIDIGLRANVDPFLKGMKASSNQITAFIGDLGKVGSQLATFAGIAGGIVVAGLTVLTKTSMAAIDSQAKLADRLGTTTEKLAGLELAAGLAGAPIEALPKVLGKLSATLGKAAMDGGPAADALEAIGLDARSLANMDSTDALGMIADGLNTIQNPAERAAATVAILGKSGGELAALLNVGSAGLREAAAEADRFGLAVSRVDAAQVEAANDAISRVGNVLVGIGNSLAVELSPFIEDAARRFTDLATSGGGVGPFVSRGIEIAVGAVGVLADGVNYLKIGFLAAQTGITIGLSVIVKGIDLFGRSLENLLNMIPGVSVSFTSTLGDISRGLDELAAEQAARLNEVIAAPPPSTAINALFRGIQDSARASAEEIVGTSTAIQAMGDDLDDTDSKIDKFDMSLAPDPKDTNPAKADTSAGALTAGSIEARSAVLSFQRGGGDDASKTAANTAAGARASEALLAEFRKMAIDSTGYEMVGI